MVETESGGEMIRGVSFDNTSFNDLPYKFEAGTPNITDVVAFRHAMFILGGDSIWRHEQELLRYASEKIGD